MVLSDALHSVRSLLCTSTYTPPHERFFSFPRRSMLGKSLPSLLTTPGPVFLRRFVTASKYEPICDEVEFLEANLSFVLIGYPDGREFTVALKDLAPCPSSPHLRQNLPCDLINTENNNPSSSIEENRLNNETIKRRFTTSSCSSFDANPRISYFLTKTFVCSNRQSQCYISYRQSHCYTITCTLT